MIDKMNWINYKQILINWWPRKLAGEQSEGQVFVDALYESLWLVKSNKDWVEWLDQIEKIWPKLHFVQPIFSSPKNNDGIDIYLGPSLGQAIHSTDDKSSLFWKFNTIHLNKNPTQIIDNDTDEHRENKRLAEKLKNDFDLFEIVASSSSSSKWIKKQLVDAYMGLSNLSLLMNIDKKRIGDGKLKIWMYEHSYLKGAINSSGDHIEIHQKCGNFGHAWAYWKLDAKKDFHDDVYSYLRYWKGGWGNKFRSRIEHQSETLDKFKRALKYQLDHVPVTSEMGQRAFRRYRAACKWVDDIHRGNSTQAAWDGWVKLKMGNKIAWSGEHAKEFPGTIKNWAWEEGVIDCFFWKNTNWNTPSWVKRAIALNKHETKWNLEVDEFGSSDIILLWAMGIEAMLRQDLDYDSWLAREHVSHPRGYEAVVFRDFFEEHLKKIIK